MRGLPFSLLLLLISSLISFSFLPPFSLSHKTFVKVYAPAVSRTEEGYIGVITEIEIYVEKPGQGDVFFSVNTLTEIDMQASARVAALVASEVTGRDYRSYNYYVKVISEAPIIGGPSAGALMTIAMIAIINNWSLNPKVTMTGMINPDGTIGPVGGIFEKAEAAHRFGIKIFLIPYGQAIVRRVRIVYEKIGPLIVERRYTEKVNITEYALKNWGMIVKEVADIREAIYYFTGYEIPSTSLSINISIPQIVISPLQWMFKELLSSANSLIENTTELKVSNSFIRSSMNRLLSEAKSKMSLANNYAERGYYYVAASLVFQAVYTTQYANYLGKYGYSGEKILNAIISEVNETLQDAKTCVRSVNTLDLISLELLIGAKLRLKSALEEFERALKYRRSWNIEDVLWSLAYAKWRAKTAKSWANLAMNVSKKYPVNINILHSLVKDYLYEAQTMSIYVNQIFEEAGATGVTQELASEALKWVEYSKNDYSKGDLLLSLAEALSAIVYSCTAMSLFSAVEKEVLLKQVEISRNLAISQLISVSQFNMTPILAFCYFEFANFSQFQGDFIQALLNYKDSITYAKLIYTLFKSSHSITYPNGTITPSVPNITKPESPNIPQENEKEDILNTILKLVKDIKIMTSFSIGIMVGILIGILRRRKTREEWLHYQYP